MEFNFNFISGIIASLLAQLIWIIFTDKFPIIARIISKIYGGGPYNLSGTWFADFTSTSEPENKIIEIYKIKHFGRERVKFANYHYSTKYSQITRDKGFGLFRGIYLSGIYYPHSEKVVESGAILLKLQQGRLSGIYMHHINREGVPDRIAVSNFNNFSMRRITLPLKNNLRGILGAPYFKNYKECAEFVKEYKET